MVITVLGCWLLFCGGFWVGKLYYRALHRNTSARLDAMLNTIHELQKALGVRSGTQNN